VALRAGWGLYAVCLMDTHYHLVVQPSDDLSDGMRVLNGAHSRAFNKRHGRRGALFESRYRERTIPPWSTYPGCALRELLAACLRGV
jgi:putative transposase